MLKGGARNVTPGGNKGTRPRRERGEKNERRRNARELRRAARSSERTRTGAEVPARSGTARRTDSRRGRNPRGNSQSLRRNSRLKNAAPPNNHSRDGVAKQRRRRARPRPASLQILPHPAPLVKGQEKKNRTDPQAVIGRHAGQRKEEKP